MGFFDIFRKSVKKTKQNLSLELDNFSGKITADTLEELEEILILADVGVTTAGKICSRLGERIKHKSIDSAELRQNLCEIVTELMEPDEPLQTETKPSVVLVVGVNGVGKTTSIGKLAYWLQGQGKKVLLGAADTFRAAAGEQLGIWAGRVGCQMVKHAEGADPAAVVYDSITAAKARNIDVLICDTAGRLHTKKNLMEELAKIDRVLEREAPGCSRETLLVLDATTGQNGLNQAREFAAACGVTGVMQPFVRSRRDLETVRRALDENGGANIRLFAKIENQTGLERLPEFLETADEIVIARGDLGNAMPLWELPAAQKRIEAQCRKAGKPFMVVTQMLASMEQNPVPTRAEVSDIFNAVVDGAAAVMVTGETAVGKWPVEVIRYLSNTVQAAERFLQEG